MGVAVWRVTIKQKNRSIFGACRFSLRKNMCLPTQLGACSHPTGRSTVLYWCTIDARTPWTRHSVPTGPPGPHRAPTAARRPGGGSVRLTFIGGPRFGRPATPIGAGQIRLLVLCQGSRVLLRQNRCLLVRLCHSLRLRCQTIKVSRSPATVEV